MAGATPVTLGVDIGGTRLKLGLVRDGAVRARAVLPLSVSTAADLTQTIADAAAALSAAHALTPVAMGVGIPGVLGLGGGPVLQSPNLPWLNGVDLAAVLQDAVGLPVRCDNDANCVGWGEAVAGAGRGVADQLCLALGTGVGGSLVVDGQLAHGGRGRGMELGHLCVEPSGAPCGCGGQGCLEQYASKTGLLRMMAELGVPTSGDDAVPELFALAAAGEPRAKAVVHAAGCALGRAIASLHALTGVGCVVFAGGIAAALPQLTPSLRATLDHLEIPGDVQVLQGTLGTDAGVIGAALLQDSALPSSSSARRSRLH